MSNKSEPIPPGVYIEEAGHHWLEEIDYDGRRFRVVVLQWNPGAKRWSHSGEVATGNYINTEGWNYLTPCPRPKETF
jgi:hypothetical protein